DAIQEWIVIFATCSGVGDLLGEDRMFTTHCFRCGGAQYWLMFASISKRWTLARIKWWGGWAQGEHVPTSISLTTTLSPIKMNTLIWYLLDELVLYEGSHTDALRPPPIEA
ncbi:hypothetical protein BV25DRAFT_1778173, partial [Artomyces pyxidatus]